MSNYRQMSAFERQSVAWMLKHGRPVAGIADYLGCLKPQGRTSPNPLNHHGNVASIGHKSPLNTAFHPEKHSLSLSIAARPMPWYISPIRHIL